MISNTQGRHADKRGSGDLHPADLGIPIANYTTNSCCSSAAAIYYMDWAEQPSAVDAQAAVRLAEGKSGWVRFLPSLCSASSAFCTAYALFSPRGARGPGAVWCRFATLSRCVLARRRSPRAGCPRAAAAACARPSFVFSPSGLSPLLQYCCCWCASQPLRAYRATLPPSRRSRLYCQSAGFLHSRRRS